jgi:hypothetical protein
VNVKICRAQKPFCTAEWKADGDYGGANTAWASVGAKISLSDRWITFKAEKLIGRYQNFRGCYLDEESDPGNVTQLIDLVKSKYSKIKTGVHDLVRMRQFPARRPGGYSSCGRISFLSKKCGVRSVGAIPLWDPNASGISRSWHMVLFSLLCSFLKDILRTCVIYEIIVNPKRKLYTFTLKEKYVQSGV